MISLAINEVRVAGRRAVWPTAVVLHAAAASMFVALWGPTGGVSLWEASVLQQLASMDRLATAVLLTWLSTFVLADDEGGRRGLIDWSALAGRSPAVILRSRVVAILVLAAVFMCAMIPAFVAAGEVAAAAPGELAGQMGAAFGFACLCVGITAIASIATADRLAVWLTAMLFSLVAAVGVRFFDTTLTRAIAPALAGVVMLAAAPLLVRTRRYSDGH